MGQEAESGIHWEFHQMLAEGDAPSLWMLSEAEWFLNNNFFFDSTRRVDLSVAEKSKYEIGWRLRSSPSRSEIERLPYVSMIVGDVNGEEWLLSEVWNGFEKIIIILYIVEIWNHMTWELVKLFNGRIAIVIIWETVQHDLVWYIASGEKDPVEMFRGEITCRLMVLTRCSCCQDGWSWNQMKSAAVEGDGDCYQTLLMSICLYKK